MILRCPICNNPAHPDFEKHNHMIYKCEQCGHQFIDIQKSPQHTNTVYDDMYFFEGGAGYHDYTKESNLLIDHGQRYAKLLEKYMQPGTVFDVGAAAGFILKGLMQEGWQGKGLEANSSMAQYAREQLDINVDVGIFEQYIPDKTYNLVSMIQVIAHFYDVNQAIQIAYQLLAPDGLLLIETWDRESMLARLFGEGWHEYSPPSVVNWFSASGLDMLIEKSGFEKVATGKPSKWLNGSHAKSLIGYKLQDSPVEFMSGFLGIIPDGLPIPYPSFDLFWTLYRKV